MTDETIFTEALGKTSPAERAKFLERACGDDADRRRRVEELLAAHTGVGDFLATPAAEQMGRDEHAAGATATFSGSADKVPDSSRSDPDLAFLSPSTKPGSIGRFRHYEIHEVIGKGGFGIVLKAFDEKLHRVVAIKVLSPHYAANGTARKRFTREARAAAAVAHEHVVTIHAVEDEANPPYLVMQLIDGMSLQDKLDKRGPLSLREILRIGLQTAKGLAAAHKQGLVHRDIKPANILLENGVERVKITDFGLARAVDDASVTQSGEVAGTPMYMSPEQAEGLAIDHRSDLFSLGTVLYVMSTGRPPFRATGTMAVLKRVIEDVPRPIREINPEIPQWLCDIVEKLHTKKPADRFQTATEVADLLEQHLASVQQPGKAPLPPSVAQPGPGGPRRHRWLLATMGVAFLTLIAVGIYAFFPSAPAVDAIVTVQTEEPGVILYLDGREVDAKSVDAPSPAGTTEFRVPPGNHKFEARLNDRHQRVIHQQVFMVKPDERMTIHVPHSFTGSPLFEGRWSVMSEETGGTQLSADRTSGQWWEFKGPYRFHKFNANDDPAECEYRLDPSWYPPHIDLISSETVLQGIYQLTENDLTVCFSTPPEPRPNSFVTRRNTSLYLTHLRRELPSAIDAKVAPKVINIRTFHPSNYKPETAVGVIEDQGGWKIEAKTEQDVSLFFVPFQTMIPVGRLILRGQSKGILVIDANVDVSLRWRRQNGFIGGAGLVPVVIKKEWEPWKNAIAIDADASGVEIALRFHRPGTVWLKDLELSLEIPAIPTPP